jgi:iron complex outermembrane receptor protein
VNGLNTLGRWTQSLFEGSTLEAQAFYDHVYRNEPLGEYAVDTVDLTLEHTTTLGERNMLIWGLGNRFTQSQLLSTSGLPVTFLEDKSSLNLFSAFVQDEFQILPERLSLTLGTKVEHNDFTGVEVQPSARLTAKPAKDQTIWASVSRAVRTPSESEGRELILFVEGPPVTGPGGGLFVPTVAGNTGLESEALLAYELGYRIQPGPRVSVDVAAFYSDYSDLVAHQPGSFIPGVPVGTMIIQPVNSLNAESYGGEMLLTLALADPWRLSAGYSFLVLQAHGEPASAAENLELNAPTHQAVLRSSHDFSSCISLDAQLRCVDNVRAVPNYVTADIRLVYRPAKNLELSIVGQNLLDDQHPEQFSVLGRPTIEVPRGIYAKLTWRF